MNNNANLTPDGVLLKFRFDKLIGKCGGVKRAENMTRVGQRVLYDYANPERSELFAPVDVVADLEKACGDHLVTEGLAIIGGGYFLKPSANENAQRGFGVVMPAVGRDVGELLRDAYAATGGKFSGAEVATLRADIQRTISDLAQALGALDGAAA